MKHQAEKLELCLASLACENFKVLLRGGDCSQMSAADSALLTSIFRPLNGRVEIPIITGGLVLLPAAP